MSAASRKRWNEKISRERAERRAERQRLLAGDIVPPSLPSPYLDALELVEERKRKFNRRKNYEEARALIHIPIPTDGPYAILHFGDPHVDDDGTDIGSLQSHMDLVLRTPGMFAANLGDTRNNWVGRLARLFANQSTSAAEAKILAEWFITSLRGKWAYLIGGNHDLWSGQDDPLPWICQQVGALYEASEARMSWDHPSGVSVTVNARHDFKGNSQWNNAHPVMKAAMLGVRDDIFICGHKHRCGYGVIANPENQNPIHCLQVSTYKIYDDYGRAQGFANQHISPCVVTLINPQAGPLGRVHVYHDPFEAAEHLTWLRSRAS